MTAKKEKGAALEIYEKLVKRYPDAACALHFSSPLELLVATVLSAQCTDKRVNEVTAKLFQKYREPQDYLDASAEELEADIRSTGFFRQKTKSLRGIMAALIEKYGGEVPQNMEDLTQLPGIGRKTANVVLGDAFDVPGIAVDTHVSRVSQRIGLSDQKNADKIEQDLMKLYSEDRWIKLSHLLIFHGRYTCKSQKPLCSQCPVANMCNYYQEQASGN